MQLRLTGSHSVLTSRRSVLLAGCLSAASHIINGQQKKIPAGATDTHIHIYNPQFQTVSGKVLTAPYATVADYQKLQTPLQLTRLVAVQPSAYATDNRCLIDALGRFGSAIARGIAVVNPSVSDDELRRLHHLGVRGIRFNLVQAGATTPEMIQPLANRIAEFGWHVQVNSTTEQIVAMSPLWDRLPVQVLFDHFGHVASQKDAAFGVITRLLEKEKAWVKISGAETISKTGPPRYADSGAVAQAYVDRAPERVLWGSNWPHVTTTPKPDDRQLLAALNDWIGTDKVRNQVLITNPSKLFGFAE